MIPVAVLLVVITWLVFGQTIRFGFVNYDDDRYVYKNPVVTSGLTIHGIVWAFTHSHGNNWHPLTTLSHMLDCQLFGLNAGAQHGVNVLLHTVAVLLLFFVLRDMTGSIWRSAFVAAVFAIHPLRAESVAWISERKDVLSGVFFMLTLGAYVRYARAPSIGRYLAVSILFLLGLMSKPMLVTMPAVLLLLDYWPLRRATDARQLVRLITEKLPLFLLAAIFCVMTIWAQSAGIASSDKLPFVLRIENAIVSCVVYIWQTFWPVRLAAFYPHPEKALKIWQVALAFALLLSVSLSAIALRKRCGYFFAGWFWYLGMLLPVIGLVQVGMQGHADRYTYLPQIGFALMITWAAADLCASRLRSTKILAPVLAIAILIALASCSFKQVSFWRDSESLWAHTLAVTSNNAIAHNQLGDFLFNRGRIDEAIVQFEKSINVRPGYAEAQNNLGIALTAKGQFDSAAIHLKQAVELRPGQPKAHYDLANALSQQGERSAAITQYEQALALDPNYADAHFNLATVLARDGQIDAAESEYRKAISDNPNHAEAHYALGSILFEKGRIDEALIHYQEALRNRPDYPEVENNIALVLLRKGRPRDALAHWRRSLELRPDFTESLNNLAWLLATFPDDTLRNGTEAITLAERAQQISGGKEPSILRTLAAAYAEAGRFAEAIDTAQGGVRLSAANGNSELADIFERDLISYRANRPIRTALQPTN